ncbi:MAG: hypothetical protein ABI832_09470 [bacterium]
MRLAVVLIGWGLAAGAQDLALEHSASVVSLEAQVFCEPAAEGERVDAPETRLGYIITSDIGPMFRGAGQVVPAALGLSFGVEVVMAREVPRMRLELTRPDLAPPDVWYDDFPAGMPVTEFFSFDFPEEQVPGVWLFEGWDGDERLFRVEFSVLPEAALPDEVARCRVTS